MRLGFNENQKLNSTWTPSFYGYDGHGSVRQLTNSSGTITDTYDYDAFGNLVSRAGNTPNNYLFGSEQYDPNLGFYYNRARYYSRAIGRFWSADSAEGRAQDPQSLHKYIFAGGNPVDRTDPSGNDFDLTTQVAVVSTVTVLANLAISGLALVAPNGKRDGTGLPSGLLLSVRAGLGTEGLYGGGGVDFYLDRRKHQLYYAPTLEGGTSPITIFKNYKGGAYSVAFGGAWVDAPWDLGGLGFSAVWPGRFFTTVLGMIGGTKEPFAHWLPLQIGTLTSEIAIGRQPSAIPLLGRAILKLVYAATRSHRW